MWSRSADGLPGATHVTDIQQFVDLLASRQPLGFGHLRHGFLLQGLEQAVELHGCLFLPVQLQQAFDQLRLLLIEQETVGQVQIDGIATVHVRAGQAQKQPELAGQARQKPTGANVRVQADADLRHGQAAARRDDADARPLQQAHAAAEHITVAPADQRFRVGVKFEVQAIFRRKKMRGQWRYFARMGATGFHQAAHFAAGAKGLGAIAAQQDADDLRVLGPGSSRSRRALIIGRDRAFRDFSASRLAMPMRAPSVPVSSSKCRFIVTSIGNLRVKYDRCVGKCRICVRSIDKRDALS